MQRNSSHTHLLKIQDEKREPEAEDEHEQQQENLKRENETLMRLKKGGMSMWPTDQVLWAIMELQYVTQYDLPGVKGE